MERVQLYMILYFFQSNYVNVPVIKEGLPHYSDGTQDEQTEVTTRPYSMFII